MKSKGTKICMISCTHGPEDDRIFWKECISLAKEGYIVTHIAVGNETKEYTSSEGVQLIQLKKTGSNPVSRYQFYSSILQAAALQKAAVYHLHDWQLNIIGKSLQNLPWKPKVVYDAHESTRLLLNQDIQDKQLTGVKKALYTIKARQADKWEKKKANAYDAVIAAEEYVLSTFAQNGQQLKEVIHNYSFFIAEEKFLKHAKQYDAVYAGLLAPNRGIKELIEAAALCIQQKPTFCLLLIGSFADKDFEQKIRKQISVGNLEQVVILKNSVPYSEIQQYLLQSRIGLCTWWLTEKNKQALPIKLFEYMACGLPVVFSNGGVASVHITKYECGLLANPASPGEIAMAICRLLDDTAFYMACASNGQKAVQNSLHWRYEEEKLLALYKKLLS